MADAERYARVMTKALFSVGGGSPLSEVLLDASVAGVERYLQQAIADKELGHAVATTELAALLGANQWGVILLWSKGLIASRDLKTQTIRTLCLTLSPLARGKTKTRLQSELEQIS